MLLTVFADGTASPGVAIVQELFDLMKGCMSDIATTMTSNALFLIPVAIFVTGGAIGLAKRIIG